MMLYLRVVLALSVAVSAVAGSMEKTFSYKGADGESHIIEVYYPENHTAGNKASCFVFFHGGGWSSGDLDHGRPFCEYLASRGMVALTVNYSMHSKEDAKKLPDGESRKRICVMDGKSVLRWVKQHADELGIDPDRIVAGGASAGAHISVLQMMDKEFSNPADLQSINTEVQALVLLCPAFTLPERDRTPEMNVFQYLEKEFPPMLFIVGETDKWKTASDKLIADLKERKQPVEVWMGTDVGHMFFRTRDWMTPTLLQIDAFLAAEGFLVGETGLQMSEGDQELVPIP